MKKPNKQLSHVSTHYNRLLSRHSTMTHV